MREPVALVAHRRRVSGTRLLAACTSAVLTVSCGSPATTLTGPTPSKCRVTLANTAPIAASGGTGLIAVTTTEECTWSVSTQASWLSELSPATGQGTGQVEFRAAANSLPSEREGEIAVNDQRAVVRQEAAACGFEVASHAHDVEAGGGVIASSVSTLAGCAWTAESGDSWITATPASANGSGAFTLTIAVNEGTERVGSATVAERRIVIRQGAATTACAVAIVPTAQTVGAGGGAGAPITVAAAPSCTWSVVSNAPWITVMGSPTRSGSGVVDYTVAAHTGGGRTGTLSIGGQTFAVTQSGAANCSYSIGSSAHTIDASGGGAPPVHVSTTPGCSWTAVSTVGWITIMNGASQSGSGSVTYEVAANAGAARSATLAIAGHVFTLTQLARPCSYTIAPSSAVVGVAGGAGTPFALTTSAGCAWSLATDVPWITITSIRAGSGPTTITYDVAANSGGERRGSISVGGQSFSVTQAASCTYSISPASHSAPSAGGARTIDVSTPGGCSWTAASNAAWISVSSGQIGSGNGSVIVTVAANAGASRTGTVTIAGHTLTVSQATGCTYSIAPTSQSIGSTGGPGAPVTVTAANGCAWSAASSAPWIAIASGHSGDGNGSVTFLVSPNSGASRTGTLTIAGATFTLTQAAVATTGALSGRARSWP